MADLAEIIPLGQRLKERREKLGISQAQAARELDVARTAYRLWELEAARPHADRWRSISRWLGISVAALLLAEELTQSGEAEEAELIAGRMHDRGTDWDVAAARETGDYFAQERATISNQSRSGTISSEESDRLTVILDRIEEVVGPSRTSGWRSAELRKDLIPDARAPIQASAALIATASGIPSVVIDQAKDLIEELVADAVPDDAAGSQDSIGIHILVNRHVLHVEVTDPLTDPLHKGAPVLLEGASRWGGGSEHGRRRHWFELDLPEPGRRVQVPNARR